MFHYLTERQLIRRLYTVPAGFNTDSPAPLYKLLLQVNQLQPKHLPVVKLKGFGILRIGKASVLGTKHNVKWYIEWKQYWCF